ncbi:hypothetical protein ACQ4LE_003811 [Meloidogyne hapla]|uniref:Uncharacterized protein n=1 Tax=Meloidogyne hapla TaxID=6305 RepID=A0A1I8BE24_MELHA
MSSSTEQNRRRFASSPFTWRSQSAPNRDKWYRRGPLSRQRSRQESSGGESSLHLDHMVSRRLVSAIAAWHDLHVSLLQLSLSRAELNNVERKEIERKLTIRRRDGSDDSSSPSLVGSKRPSQRGRVEQRRISTKIRKVTSIRPSTLCPKTQIEQECHQTISSPSSSSTSLSYLCSTTTNDSQNKKLEEEKINEKLNEEVKNIKNRSNSIGRFQREKSREHSLIHQNTENNEITSSPATWTATFAQSLQIRSSSTRRRFRSPRPSGPAKHILILKHSVQLIEPKTQGIECIKTNNLKENNLNKSETNNSLKRKGKRRCFSVAKLDENRKQSNSQTKIRRRQFSYQSEDTDNEAIISDYINSSNEPLNLTSCSSGEISENELDVIYNQERINSKSCLSSPELSPDELKQLFPELSDHWR